MSDLTVRVLERISVTQTRIELLSAGRQGPPGTSAASYTFTQAIAANQWTINHNLGFRPVVELYDEGGNRIEADVSNPTVNQTLVQFNTTVAGSARLT